MSTTTTATQIHYQYWRGDGSIELIEMTNAGKRGKSCRVIRIASWNNTTQGRGDCDAARACRQSHRINNWISQIIPDMGSGQFSGDLDEIVRDFHQLIDTDDRTKHERLVESTIKGIHGPVPCLTAGVSGQFSASACQNGISIHDEVDQNNLPCLITSSSQTHPAAYAIAKRVWHLVEAAKTFREAGNILGEAGAKLHYYCRMD